MSNIRQSTLSLRLFRAPIVLAAGGLLLGAVVVAQEIKSLHLRLEQHRNGAGSERRLRLFERWSVTLLGLFILHTLRRLEDRPLQDNDEKAGREGPGAS